MWNLKYWLSSRNWQFLPILVLLSIPLILCRYAMEQSIAYENNHPYYLHEWEYITLAIMILSFTALSPKMHNWEKQNYLKVRSNYLVSITALLVLPLCLTVYPAICNALYRLKFYDLFGQKWDIPNSFARYTFVSTQYNVLLFYFFFIILCYFFRTAVNLSIVSAVYAIQVLLSGRLIELGVYARINFEWLAPAEICFRLALLLALVVSAFYLWAKRSGPKWW